MAVLAQQIAGPGPEKTVVRRAFDLNAGAPGTMFPIPLMGIVAGWAGNIADGYGFSGCFVVKGKVIEFVTCISSQIDDQLVLRVRCNFRDFITGGTLF